MTEIIKSVMTSEEASRCVAKIKAGMDDVRLLVLDLYERQGWIALNYESWRECVGAEFKQSQTHLYRLLDAAQVERAISPMGEILIPERQARELAPLMRQDETEMVDTWHELQAEHGDKVTAKIIKAAVQSKLRKEERRVEMAEQRETMAQSIIGIEPDARWHIELGDIRTYQTDERFDFIITDPPYPREYLELYEVLAARAVEWLKPGGSLLVMCGKCYLPEILAAMTKHITYNWTLAYLTPGGQATQLWQQKVNSFWKPVLWFVNGDYTGQWIGDVTKSAPNDNDKRLHDWGQSESGFSDLMARFVLPGQRILDPFCGGGTTGVVAVHLDCLFTGIDNDQKAIETTIARLQCLK